LVKVGDLEEPTKKIQKEKLTSVL